MKLITGSWMQKKLYLATPIIFLLAGCSSSMNESMAKDRLEQARAVYTQAQTNPNVTGAAQLPLVEAGKDLQAAENTTNYTEMEHRAYLAQRKAETALALGEGKAADREVEALQRVSNETIIKVKEQQMAAKGRELQSAQTAAERARGEAMKMKGEAESARGEALTARQEALTMKGEAEKTRAQAEQARVEAERTRAEMEKAKAENDQLLREVSELKGKETDRGLVLTLGDVLFDTGKADLSPQANVSIGKLAQFLLNHPKRTLSIEGHTDSVGSDDYNYGLSLRRAEAIKSALVAKGVSSDRIEAKGLGKKFPIATNATSQGRQLNRRVEVVVINEGAAGASGAAAGGATETPAQRTPAGAK